MGITVRRIIYAVVFACVIVYLFMGTGLHSDDYCVIGSWGDWREFIFIDPYKMWLNIFGFPTYYIFWWAYFVMGFEQQWIYDLIKGLTHLVSLVFVYKFACDYFPRDRAILAAALFVFYPLHETTMYWYMTVSYILVPSVLMYAHSLIRNEKNFFGFFLLILGAFADFSSPPYVFGLACIFLFERKYKTAVLFAFPSVLYVAYYFLIKFIFPGIERRINASLTFVDFLKQLLLQPLSFFEAAIGPSYWLKIYYAISSISLLSFLLASCIVVNLFVNVKSFTNRLNFPKSLFIGLFSILLLSFGMFALTGLYHHSAFNLGNRTTVYGSLLIAFLLAILPINRKTIVFFALIFIFPVFGMSDYWKSWNEHQKAVIKNIHSNKELAALKPESTLLVIGNIYSKLGPFSHIELFSMPWVVNPIFRVTVKSQNIIALTSYIKLDQQTLIDPKFGGKFELSGPIYLYNSEKNIVRRITLSEIPQLLSSRPKEIRHWVQLVRGTWIESSIIAMSPRLVYLFQ